LPKIITFCERHGSVEVLIVDDGSGDATAAVVKDVAARHTFVRLVSNPGNRGKGYSVRHGMQESTCDWILSTKADRFSTIDEVEMLGAAVEGENAAVGIGSLAVDRSLVGVHQSPLREWSGRFFNIVMRFATCLPFRDTQCGFKLFRQDAARAIFARQRL